MADLNKALPKINFYLHENKTKVLLQELADGKLDILILPLLDGMEKFERFDLFEEPLVMAMSPEHELANKSKVKFDDLQNRKILTLEDGHCLRDQAMGYCFSAGADEDQRFKATSLETLRYMVASNMGVTLLPKLATMSLAENKSIQYTSFISPEPVRQISLLLRPNYSRMACIREVVKTVKASMKKVF